ncbi:VPA1267 family protein [Massilia sp. TWR1-2-2]|uniref:VPA1267 family protein n=1 Tax=Massilia sp. TWR1-2-2 TaxID=2804584 RepID=UPI003CEBD18A
MANGQQLAEQNFRIFTAWLASRSDEDFKQLVTRGSLSRKEIAAQCGFAISALNQNPRVKAALSAKETLLREVGILPAIADSEMAVAEGATPVMREVGAAGRAFEVERLRRLEQENASLKAENGQLKRELERFAVLREVLAETGRLPR